MGADIKKLRNRIKSVDSTLHLTRAMGLVASSKIRRATEAMNRAREYEAALGSALDALLASSECQRSVYMRPVTEGKDCLVVIAGDRGLAGGYNANVFRALRAHPDAAIVPIGKRAVDRFHGELVYAERFDYAAAQALSSQLCEDFRQGKYSRIGILSTHYISMMSQEAAVSWILPLSAKKEVTASDGIFEPDELTVLETAVPAYVAGRLYCAVRESFASEVAARRTAMDSAGKNATAMLDELGLQYNRARQGSITQEITEIVAGSNAD